MTEIQLPKTGQKVPVQQVHNVVLHKSTITQIQVLQLPLDAGQECLDVSLYVTVGKVEPCEVLEFAKDLSHVDRDVLVERDVNRVWQAESLQARELAQQQDQGMELANIGGQRDILELKVGQDLQDIRYEYQHEYPWNIVGENIQGHQKGVPMWGS